MLLGGYIFFSLSIGGIGCHEPLYPCEVKPGSYFIDVIHAKVFLLTGNYQVIGSSGILRFSFSLCSNYLGNGVRSVSRMNHSA